MEQKDIKDKISWRDPSSVIKRVFNRAYVQETEKSQHSISDVVLCLQSISAVYPKECYGVSYPVENMRISG
jgi:hypothetical protein